MAPPRVPALILRLPLTRREAFGLAGLATGMLVAACGGGSGSGSPLSGPVTTHLDGASVPSSEQITKDVINGIPVGDAGQAQERRRHEHAGRLHADGV